MFQIKRKHPKGWIFRKLEYWKTLFECTALGINQNYLTVVATAQIRVTVVKQLVKSRLLQTVIVLPVSRINELPLGIQDPSIRSAINKQIGLKPKHRAASMLT